MSTMLNLYGSNGNTRLLAKGGQCKGTFLERQIGGKLIVAIKRRASR